MPQFYDPSLMVDLRSLQHNPPPAIGQDGKPKARYRLDKTGKVFVRDPKTVTGITVHQTAVNFVVVPYQIKAAGGDAVRAEHLRLMTIPAHAVASDQQGKFVVHIPLEWWAYHGHGLNPFTLGLEIETLQPGVVGGSTWNGKPASPWGPDNIKSARNALGYLYEEGRRAGMPIETVWAHRQSTAKPSDPGQQVWQDVVIDFAVKELKLKPQYSTVFTDSKGNKGKTIPIEWDPNGIGHY